MRRRSGTTTMAATGGFLARFALGSFQPVVWGPESLDKKPKNKKFRRKTTPWGAASSSVPSLAPASIRSAEHPNAANSRRRPSIFVEAARPRLRFMDEFWCGRATTRRAGKTIASPEMFFWPPPASRTKRIKLGTGVVCPLPLPTIPFNVAPAHGAARPHDRAARRDFWLRPPGCGLGLGCALRFRQSNPMTQREPPGTRRSASSRRLFNGEARHGGRATGFVHERTPRAADPPRCRRRWPFVVASQNFRRRA